MRKVNMAAVNGGSSSAIASAALSRRRQRNGSYRDSPDEGAIEVAENSRLRDRPGKRERDRDRSGRNIRRRRGERVSHDVDDDEDESSDETLEDDDEDELHGRLPTPSSTSYHHQQHQQQQQQHQMVNYDNHRHPSPTMQTQSRKSFPQPTTNWKADEMLGVAVPRKARSAMKRSDGSWISGGGEQIINRQSSASPSPQISPPSSSNAPGRKKLRPISGGKLRPPSASKQPPAASLVQDELEVAEVLFGLTRQFESASKAEGEKADDEIRNESKSGAVSSCSGVVGSSYAVPLPNSSITAIAPKRKRPRKVEDESTVSSVGAPLLPSTSISSSAKMDHEKQLKMAAASSPKSEKNESLSIQNVAVSFHISTQVDEDIKLPVLMDKAADSKSLTKSVQLEAKEDDVSVVKENTSSDLGTGFGEETAENSLVVKDKSSDVKFHIDLMAPPPEKLSADYENDLCGQEPDQMAKDAASSMKIEMKKKDKEKLDEPLAERKIDKSLEESDSKCQNGKEIISKLQIDLERTDKDNIDGNKMHAQNQTKTVDLESKQEKSVQNSSPSTPLIVSGWQGNFPPFGYTGQVPPVKVVLPSDASNGSPSMLHPSGILSPQPPPKRCATHCYIAQKIHYHQQLARANPIWSAAAAAAAAAGTIPLYGAKHLAPNGVPPVDAVLQGKSMHGNLLARNVGSSKDNYESSRATVDGQPLKEISSVAGNAIIEGIEKKQFLVPQLPLSVSGPNMLPGPAFIFPVNQQQAVAASMAATVTGASKSTAPNNNAATASGPTSSMNLSFAGLAPNEAQYLAIVQNGGYPFPIPANVAAAASQQYRGLPPAGTIPFFGSPFYSSQVLHPSQVQQQQQQPMTSHPLPPHHVYQNSNNPVGSSSTAKHSQLSQQAPGAAAAGSSHAPAENEKGSSSNQIQNNPYGQKYALPISSQNLTLMSSANPSAIGSSAGSQTDKQSWNQHQQKQSGRVELPSSKVFAMPFTSINGMATLPPGLDFSSMAQSGGVLLQNLPESFRQQYSHMTIPASSATAYVAQQKAHTHNAEDVASIPKEGRSVNGKSEEDSRKAPSTAIKILGSGSQTLTFSRADEPVTASMNNNAADNSSLTLNLMANHSTSAAATATTTGDVTTTMNISNPQLIQMQKLQQKQLAMQNQYPSSRSKSSSSHNSLPMYTERSLPGAKFSQPLAGLPQTVAQGSNSGSSSTPSPQWKVKARDAAVSPGTTSSQSAVKNNVLPQQGRAVQQPVPSQIHQNLVSFGANLMKAPSPGLQQHPMHSNSQPSATVTNPSQHNVSKSSLVAAQASSNAKPGPPTSVLSIPQKSSSAKISSSNSIHKSSSALGNHEPTSVTSQSSAAPANSSGTKSQQQVPQHSQKQSQHSQSQIFFANGYMQQPHSASPNIAARFFQTRPSDQSQQQNLTLGSSMVVPESSAAVSTSSSNGLPSPGLMHAAQLTARASSLVPASFSYMSAPTVSVKPTADKKPSV